MGESSNQLLFYLYDTAIDGIIPTQFSIGFDPQLVQTENPLTLVKQPQMKT